MKSPLVLALALFVVGEVTVRWGLPDDFHGNYTFGYRPDEGINVRDGTVMIAPTRQRRLRPNQFPLVKHPERNRIFVFGDSVARGSVSQRPYARRVEDFLREQEQDVEVANFAAIGAGVRKIRKILQATMRYEPDVVVLHLNTHNEGFDTRDWNLRQQFLNGHPKFWLAHSRLFRSAAEWKRSHLYERWVPGMAGPSQDGADKFVMFGTASPALKEIRRRTVLETTPKNIALIRSTGAKVLLISPVRVSESEGRFEFDDEGFDKFCAELRNEQVDFISMSEVFAGDAAAHLRGDGVHLDDAGHTRLGRMIAGRLLANGWLK